MTDILTDIEQENNKANEWSRKWDLHWDILKRAVIDGNMKKAFAMLARARKMIKDASYEELMNA